MVRLPGLGSAFRLHRIECGLLWLACLWSPAAWAEAPEAAPDLDLEIEDEAPPAPPAAPATGVAPAAPDPALLARLAELEARTAALEAPPEPPPAVPWYEDRHLAFSGYLQAQGEVHQLSEDEVTPDGAYLNQDRFLVRRGRFKAQASWTYAAAVVEIDANTLKGPFVYARTAEAALRWPRPEPEAAPYARLGVGLATVPYGFELRQSSRDRMFVERTLGTRAFFPSVNDVGARLSGKLGPFVYDLGATNGVPLPTDPTVTSLDPVAHKTLVGRIGAETGHAGTWSVTGGISALRGLGFHAGDRGTKDLLLWQDANEDGLVTLNELVAAQGQVPTPSETFARWATGADLEVGFATPLGWTQLQAEGTLAANLDRGYTFADPISTGFDLRETSWSVAIVQELGSTGLAGLRVDRYDPNADLFESQRGRFLPLDASVLTIAPALGARVGRTAKVVGEWDYVVDHLGRDRRARPIDLPNDVWTLRLQVGF